MSYTGKLYFMVMMFALQAFDLNSQSLADVFKLLPLECTPELSYKQRDTLLMDGAYTLPVKDSLEIVEYTIDTESDSNYIRYDYNFTTGQTAFIVFELRKFKTGDGKVFIVFSRYGGLPTAFEQNALKIYYPESDTLREFKHQKLLPEAVDVEDFLKPGTPNSIKTKLHDMVSCSYDLSPAEDEVYIRLVNQTETGEDEKWIASYIYAFTWNGKVFKKRAVKDE